MTRRSKKLTESSQGKQQGSQGKQPRPNAELDGRFFKTKLCTFHRQGLCSKGASCQFAHTQDDVVLRPTLYRTTLCLNFARQGMCKYGEQCRYSHTPQDVTDQAGDHDIHAKSFEAALYEESISSNLLSAVSDATSKKEHDALNDKESGRTFEEYWAPKISAETDDYMASSQDTQSCSDIGTSSLESEFDDAKTFEPFHTDDLQVVTGIPVAIEVVVKNTFLQFGTPTHRSTLRRAQSADGRGFCFP